MGLLATAMVFVLSGINDHNLRQDVQISEVQKTHQETAIRQERVFRELSEQNADTAQILEGVARQLEAIDERGSRALKQHEDTDHTRTE